ncbi:urease accessory protein [bacterium]|nr:urease accessory protein [bacterium]
MLRLKFENRGTRSILSFSERRAPLLVQRALYCDEGMPEMPVVYVITNSGGILQGDRYAIDFEIGENACAHITSQAATKIHEMDANHAAQTQEIVLHEGAYLEYLPEYVIPFRHSRFQTKTNIRIAASATLIYSEILAGGRKHYGTGESFEFDLFSSTVAARRLDGQDLFVERFVIEPAKFPVSGIGTMSGFDVFGNVILLTPRENAEAIYSQIQPTWNRETSCFSGASLLPNDAGLIFKVLGKDTAVVRHEVREFWSRVRPQIKGQPVPPPFAWS